MKLNAEQNINELDTQLNFAKFIKSNVVLLSAKCAQFCLEHIQYYEKKIKELTEENERVHASCTELTRNLHECKADTVRKMQERLKEHLDDFYNSGEDALLDVPDLIDEIAKEMLEDNK